MILVLLPGMGGTGNFFDPFVAALPEVLSPQVIGYPNDECLDYDALEALVRGQLPDDDFILLGESYSAPIAHRIALAPPPSLRAVVFAGGFLTPPRPWLLRLSRMLPRTALFSIPAPGLVLKLFLAGTDASNEVTSRIRQIARTLSPRVLTYRLDLIAALKADDRRCSIPGFYIRGNQDRLVPASSVDPIRRSFDNLTLLPLDGPHFILQTRPARCAGLLVGALRHRGILGQD